MFEGLLKSKFFAKCKSDIKLTRTRIEMIKKKRNAMQKYLRNDVSDLLKNGLGMNAYDRVEGLLTEINRSKCYELIDQCCALLSNHLPLMDKQRDCPEECKESVSSLVFAAARIADLPELRELRNVFSEKYGNSLDCFASKELVEKLKPGVPSRDEKIRLLEEIAAESGLPWSSKSLGNEEGNRDEHGPRAGPEPEPVRRRHLEPIREILPEEEKAKEAANKELAAQARRVLRFLDMGNDEGPDEEERAMDRLLRHYSRKKGTHTRVRSDFGIKVPFERDGPAKTGSSGSKKEGGGPVRVGPQLPGEGSGGPNGPMKRRVRASSFQPEMLNRNYNCNHVHPKLPEWDEFEARLAELRRK